MKLKGYSEHQNLTESVNEGLFGDFSWMYPQKGTMILVKNDGNRWEIEDKILSTINDASSLFHKLERVLKKANVSDITKLIQSLFRYGTVKKLA